MPQLRDSKTSEIIAEGSVADLALLTLELDEGSYLWDDVPGAMDLEAVHAHSAEILESLEGQARAEEVKRRNDIARQADAVMEVAASAQADSVQTLPAVELG